MNGFIAMGPAILHGGITTFLALIFLAFSESHVFVTFFNIVSMTVVFGLFHGLFFLPVMLILFGTDNVDDDDRDEVENSDCSTVGSDKFLKSNVKSYSSSISNVSIKEEHFDRGGPSPSVISCNALDNLDFKHHDEEK